MPTKILIVDDHDPARRLLRTLIESGGEWEVCGEARDGADGFGKVKETSPDIVLLDLYMPVMNGLETARHISKMFPRTRLLLCTIELSPQLFTEAQRAGIHGAVSKFATDEIVSGIRMLVRGRQFFPLPPAYALHD
jgi:DNA-binding NarL/FixJ family response regulator